MTKIYRIELLVTDRGLMTVLEVIKGSAELVSMTERLAETAASIISAYITANGPTHMKSLQQLLESKGYDASTANKAVSTLIRAGKLRRLDSGSVTNV